MSKPIVAIVGRPNVGKSTLFNVLAGSRISIVQDTPGVTRDRIYASSDWNGRSFTMIDTGGIEPYSNDIILSQMRRQAQLAIEAADVIILVTDVKSGLVASRSEGRRAIEQGGVSIDGEKVTDIKQTVAKDAIGDGIVLKRGKKNFRKIVNA